MNLGTFGPHVLLTGAGFSKSFGGRLATEVWADMLSRPEIQNNAKANEILLSNPLFEEALAAAASDPDPGVYAAIESATLGAFEKMDYAIDQSRFSAGYGVNIYGFQEFLNRFWGAKCDTGYLFTLNQDLLLERKYYNCGFRGMPTRPGIATAPGQRSTNVTWFSSHHIRFDDTQIAEISEARPPLQGRNNYMKLHGSMDWRSPNGRIMVMGGRKAAQIADTPLLDWYFGVFRSVLSAGGRRLMVIGYGFADEHVNEAIAQACDNAGLRVYVWNRMNPPDMRQRVLEAPHGASIWKALMGYCQDPLEIVFPGDQSKSAQYLALQENYFKA